MKRLQAKWNPRAQKVKKKWILTVAIRGCTKAKCGNRGALSSPDLHTDGSILLYVTQRCTVCMIDIHWIIMCISPEHKVFNSNRFQTKLISYTVHLHVIGTCMRELITVLWVSITWLIYMSIIFVYNTDKRKRFMYFLALTTVAYVNHYQCTISIKLYRKPRKG